MIAIIEFIAYYFDIPVIKDIISIFSNKRGFVEGSDVFSRFFVGAFPRSRSVFEEPAGLGYFILMTSSIIYELNYCKIKIFDNIIIEKLLKKSIIITMWVALILTQSPIFLIFNLLLIFYYYLIYKHNIHKLIKIFKKHIIQILVLFFLIIFCIVLLNMFYKIDVSEIYINRIVNVVTSVKIIDDFIAVEPSLATRFITCLNIYLLGIKHSFTGVGYGNMTYLMPLQFQQSPLPLTPELVLRMLNETPGNSMIAAKVFSETGIIGFILFYTFIIKLYKYVKKIISKFVNVENHFLQGVLLFIIVFVLSSLYSSNMNNPYVWIIMGISLCAIKIMIRRKDNI
ncbi:MAG: hypothetical protein LUH05_06165 [Candidatus Gastranaerophilales bacterium]|nr:hypothetical protein [Candidatus Gastranaerophilales bacterium]